MYTGSFVQYGTDSSVDIVTKDAGIENGAVSELLVLRWGLMAV